MAFTPLIRPLNPQGTTFYTFSSAARDLSKCLANSQKEFVFSHFVCIDIPDIINVANWNHNSGSASSNNSSILPSTYDKNYFQFCAIDDMLDRCYEDWNTSGHTSVKTSSQLLAELLQDYAYNFEELLIDKSEDNSTDRSVAERVFWHFMAQTGAMNFKYDENKVSPSLLNRNEKRYVEGIDEVFEHYDPDTNTYSDPIDIPSEYAYNNVVRYIGNIDITNNVDIANEAYTEIYVNIPSEAGCTPTVLFKRETDGNMRPPHYEVTLHQDWILGQTQLDNAYPVDLRALYDTRDANDTECRYLVNSNTEPKTRVYEKDIDAYWKSYSYKTDFDGLCIDFDANSYREITMGGLAGMDDFNKSNNSKSFQFNAVLVYYDIVDVSSGTRTSNLYGVLFLDDIKCENWDYMQRYPKYMPVAGVQNGNSYGFKLNLRIDIEPNKQGVTTLVNEYNTFSMSLFADAMTRLTECTDMFTRVRGALTRIESRLSDIETFTSTMANYEALVNSVAEIERTLENANSAFADRNTLVDLIARNWDALNSIVDGRANVELQYNTDVVRGGYAIDIDTSTPNRITVGNSTSGYSMCNLTLSDNTATDIENPIDLTGGDRGDNKVNFYLKPMTNMLRVYTMENTNAAYDIIINAYDTITTWRNGQNVRVVFPNLTLENLNGRNIVFRTNLSDGEDSDTSVEVIVSSDNLMGDRPIIEFTCTDSTFSNADCIVYDVLR